MSILRAYAHMFLRYRARYALGLAALVATNVLYMAIPRVLGAAVDAFRAGATRADVRFYATVILVMAMAQAVVRVGSRVWVLGVSRRVEYDLKARLHDRLVTLAPSFYQAMSTGDLMSRMTNDVTLVRALGGPGILYFANALLIYLLGMVFMVTLDWQLTIVVLAPLPLMAWIVRGMVHRVRSYALSTREALSELNTVVQENLAGAQVVRSFAIEGSQNARFEGCSHDYVHWALKEAFTRALMIPLIGLAGGLAYAGLLGIGGPRVAAGTLTLGDLVAFVSYVTMLVWPTVALGWILSLLQRGAAALERLDQVIRAPVTISSDEAAPTLVDDPVALEVRRLTFRYGDAFAAYDGIAAGVPAAARRPALEDVSLEVVSGSFIGLVGRVGSGKSTLLKSLLRLVEVPDGTVLFDGRDVNELDLASLRSRVAYVPQDDFLFSDSVSSNIRFGRPDASVAEVEGAAVLAGLDPSDTALSSGLDTDVGERGLNLSGGQRQRVALARALLTDAPTLVLDNALSNVDTETERKILGGLAGERRRRTVVAASNRITAIQDADRIYVMEAGRIVDAGRHEELIARPGLYASMHEQQQLSARLEAL